MLRLEVSVPGIGGGAPLPNAAFFPPPQARPGLAFAGEVRLERTAMRLCPEPAHPVIGDRDARLHPRVSLRCFSHEGLLIPVERGRILSEAAARGDRRASYWGVIAGIGRVWREAGDEDWSRAALPLALVNDTDNDAHQGLGLFLYRDGQISDVGVQYVQQSGPYRIPEHFVASGLVRARWADAASAGWLEQERRRAVDELRGRLPVAAPEPAQEPPGPWCIMQARVFGGELHCGESPTRWGPYPYPLEMRFGVRSVTKSVFAPLVLLHLAQRYGAEVLDRRFGDLVPELPGGWERARLIDAANMASGMGGTGTACTDPNDCYDGYLAGPYAEWFNAPTLAGKLACLKAWTAYPWEPGRVVRYRDQDFFVLGLGIERLIQRLEGRDADVLQWLQQRILVPIGIRVAPSVRTIEPEGRPGLVWCNAGYYPTLEELARIASLYQAGGIQAGERLLHPDLTAALLAGRLGLRKSPAAPDRYALGWHLVHAGPAQAPLLPCMVGSGGNEVRLHSGGEVSIRMGNAPPSSGAAGSGIPGCASCCITPR